MLPFISLTGCPLLCSTACTLLCVGDEEVEVDSDATDFLSDVEEGLAAAARRAGAASSSNSSRGGVAGGKRKRTSAVPAAVAPKQHYYIDRVSEPAQQRSTTAIGTSIAGVPQVQGVRSALSLGGGRSRAKAPVSNRQMIMKKLGMK